MVIKAISGKILWIYLVAQFAHNCDAAATVKLSFESSCSIGMPCCLACDVTSGSVMGGLTFKLNNVDMVICPTADTCVSNFPATFQYTRVNSTRAEGCILDYNDPCNIGNWSCSDGSGTSSRLEIDKPQNLEFSNNSCPQGDVDLPAILTVSAQRPGMPTAILIITDPDSDNHTSQNDADSLSVNASGDGKYTCSLLWRPFPDCSLNAPIVCGVQDPGKRTIAIILCCCLAVVSILIIAFATTVSIIKYKFKDIKVARPVYYALLALSVALDFPFVVAVGAYNLKTAIRTVELITHLNNASIAFVVVGIISFIEGIVVAGLGLK